MFTGIVEEVGTVLALERGDGAARLTIACRTVTADARAGDSISVNGVCLTVTTLVPEGFTADLMGETLDRSALGDLAPGAPVDLERALRADGRLGGHLVQGHVDGVGTVTEATPHAAGEGEAGGRGSSWTTVTIALPEALAPYVVEKGSITVDGTSLTVTAVDDASFSVGLIPHTLAHTVLGVRRPGDRVNIEVDVIAKYVERMLRGGVATPYNP